MSHKSIPRPLQAQKVYLQANQRFLLDAMVEQLQRMEGLPEAQKQAVIRLLKQLIEDLHDGT